MKAYTDIEQSKVLVEILPFESADMFWSRCTITDFGDGVLKVSYAVEPCNISQFRNTKKDVPCWSLSTLLDVLPSSTLDSSDDHHYRVHCRERFTEWHDNAIDACVEMIIKLNKEGLLWKNNI